MDQLYCCSCHVLLCGTGTAALLYRYCIMFSHLGLVQLSADDKCHVPEGQQSRGGAPRKRKTFYRSTSALSGPAPASVFRIHDILEWIWIRIRILPFFVIDLQDANKKLI